MSPPFTIDPATGRVRFPDLPLELCPGMAEATFISASTRLNRDNLGGSGDWQRYSVKALIPHDRKLGMFLVFLSGRLKMFSFAWAQEDETWDTWSEAAELAREQEYRQELALQLGGKNEFSWGRATAQLDSKSGGTEIWVNYSEPPPSSS